MKPLLSAIIVNYQADSATQELAQTLRTHKQIEVIVHDNSIENIGYGAGCNRATQDAQGEYLAFLNPDIQLTPDTLIFLAQYLEKHSDIGIIGPQIRNEENSVEITCSEVPRPWQALLLYSFLGNLPFLKSIHAWYRLGDFDHQSSRKVPSVNGSCFVMSKDDFFKMGQFDKNLFLYFEEFDLALRVENILKKSIFFTAEVSVQHAGQASTNFVPSQKLRNIFQKSRQYWLTKHFGWQGKFVALFLTFLEQRNL